MMFTNIIPKCSSFVPMVVLLAVISARSVIRRQQYCWKWQLVQSQLNLTRVTILQRYLTLPYRCYHSWWTHFELGLGVGQYCVRLHRFFINSCIRLLSSQILNVSLEYSAPVPVVLVLLVERANYTVIYVTVAITFWYERGIITVIVITMKRSVGRGIVTIVSSQ